MPNNPNDWRNANPEKFPGPTRTENDAVIEEVRRFHLTEFQQHVTPDGKTITLASVPEGRTLSSLKEIEDEYRTAPERRKGEALLGSLESLIEHANRFSDEDSALFAEVVPEIYSAALVSVLDYHQRGAKGAPRFGCHRGVYRFPLSEEWKLWTARANKPMTQQEFAAFLEERVVDVQSPAEATEGPKTFASELGLQLASPQRLLELSRGLSVRVNQRVTQAVTLSSGEGQFTFEEKHENVEQGAGAVKMPGAFAIGIPVFRLGSLFSIPVRLMYRLREGSLTWIVQPHRLDRAWQMAVTAACTRAKEATKLPLYYGSPEN